MLSSSFGNLLAMASSMITIMVATRILDKEEMGAYFLLMVVVSFANVFGEIGLCTSAIRFLSDSNNMDCRDIDRFLITINIIFSLIVSIMLWLIFPILVNTWYSIGFSKIACLGIPLVFLISNFNLSMAILAGFRCFTALSTIMPIIEVSRMIISIIGINYGYGVEWLFYSMIGSRFVGIILAWYSKPGSIKPLFRHEKASEIFSFGAWMYGSSILSIINVKAVDLILTTYMGATSLAAYSTAMQIPSMIQKVFESVRAVVLSYLSSLGLGATEISIIAVRMLTAILAITSSLLITISEPLINLVFSKGYHESVPIMQLLCTWMTIGLTNYFLLLTLTGMGKSGRAFSLSIPQLIVTLICGFLLVPRYQGVGAALTLIITSLVGNIVASILVAGRNGRVFLRISSAYLRSSIPLIIFTLMVFMLQTNLIDNISLWVALIMSLYLFRAITLNDIKRVVFR